MSNTPNFRRAQSFAEYADRRREEASIAIPLSDGGDPVVVPPGEFWPREARDLTTRRQELLGHRREARRTGGSVAEIDREIAELSDSKIAEAIVGADEWARIVADIEAQGITADPGDVFFAVVNQAVRDQQGVSPGE